MTKAAFTSRKLTQEQLQQEINVQELSFIGFYRMSDAIQAVFLKDRKLSDFLTDFSAQGTHFLYEAAFYAEGRKSIAIRQINDRWLWTETEWGEQPPTDSTPDQDFIVYTQLAKCDSGFIKLFFYTQYLPEKRNGYETLVPAWNAFIGFKEGEE